MMIASKSNKKWSEEEDLFLLNNYANMSAKEVSRSLGRSVKGVQRRAYKLGVANKTPRITLSQVKEAFSAEGLQVLENEYKNSHQKLRVKCFNGHMSYLSWNKFTNGRRCSRCYYDPGDMYARIKSSFEAAGYQIHLSRDEYESSKQKILFTCPNGHRYKIDWNCFSQGQRCAKCNPNVSGAEREIALFVEKLGIRTELNVTTVISPYELDIYIPASNVAIEYCGLYWHSDQFKNRSYHYEKMEQCFKKGIRLITVFEDEYLDRPNVVLSRLKSILGKASNRVYARNTVFKPISTKLAKEFLYTNHLQGYSPCRYKFGLFSGSELVQVMTFGVTTRKHAGYEGLLELKRLASVQDTIVVGGPEKLLKNSLLVMPDVKTIKSYCDMRWANPIANVYDKLGFTCVGFTKYTPHYFKRQKRYRNHTLRKTPTERLFSMTEHELRKSQGFGLIWDCGHRTYVLKVDGGE